LKAELLRSKQRWWVGNGR